MFFPYSIIMVFQTRSFWRKEDLAFRKKDDRSLNQKKISLLINLKPEDLVQVFAATDLEQIA